MKKFCYFFSAAFLAMGMVSCSGNDTEIEPDVPTPGPGPVEQSSAGVFIVNSGSMYSNIDGSLSYFSYSTGTVFSDVFKANNNGMTVGDTFNSGYVFEGRIYLAVTDSKVIHVINQDDYKLVKTISIDPTLGGPRHITACNGMIYVSLFGQPGYVAEIDPETLEVTKTVEVGPLPEDITNFNGMLYVAVSDGRGDGSEACVAVIDPESFKVTSKITGVVNPVNLVTNGSRLFVCGWGRYMSEPPYSQYDYGAYEVTGSTLSAKLCDATYICIYNNSLYYLSAPYSYGDSEARYGVYDIASATDKTFISAADGVDSPIAIGVDPIEGDVFILSYHFGEGGYASYNTPGYVKRYQADGSVVGTFDAGVGPTSMFFNVVE